MATIVVPEHVSIHEDADAVYRACKGWGTDEKALISILGHRNAFQRRQIRQAYAELYNEDLIKRLESELKGDFERAVYRWMLDPEDRDAVLAHVAIRKSGDYHVIIEIACALNSEELLAVRRAYHARYRCSLEEDIAAHTAGDLRGLLVGLVTAYRYQGDDINASLAKSEADVLHDAIKHKVFNHVEVLRIITTRSKAQLMATFNSYRDDQGTSVAKALLDEPGDEFKESLRTAIRCLNDHKKYYEKVLRHAIRGHGTDEDALTRVIVTRAERDLLDIKELYYKRNSETLDDAVARETSGDYKAFLLALLGKHD